jgi:lipopolysaccharide export system protein LptC
LSQNETLRVEKLAAGTGGLATFEKNQKDTGFAWPNVATAGMEEAPAGFRAVRFDVTPAPWRGGFKAAHRHSARVRLFRGAAIAGSLLAIVLISAAVLVSPLRRLPGDVSIGRVGLDGAKVILDFPKISGLQKNGRPFEIKARSGIQDLTIPNVIELLGIESTIGTADTSTTWVNAAHGIYNSSHDKLTLEGDIRIKNSAGYDIWLKTARIDFKTGGLISEEPVKVVLEGGTIAAKELDVSENGHKVSFGGEVTSTIDTGGEESGATRAIAQGEK